jgi:hypothetical protein
VGKGSEGACAFRQHENPRRLDMRGTYEAYILVKVKDGRQYVCALNRAKDEPDDFDKLSPREQLDYLEHRVIWN